MTKEFKVVFTIGLIYLIYGLNSLFSLGGFATPIFLNAGILFLVSLYFLIVHLKVKDWFYLLGFNIAILAYTLQDGFVRYLFERNEFDGVVAFLDHNWLAYIGLFLYFSFFFIAIFYLYKQTKNIFIGLGLSLLLLLCLALKFNNLFIYADLIFNLFLIVFMVGVYRLKPNYRIILEVLSAQFTLILLLDFFKYII
ncbi:hypothetical protein [Crocinitomix catalasitica]|uniref:hypothetical protein n=1 Tax=Crocinitomix catalasitica TaxID=184607 RepID=UPI000484E931|nr:hypothetical protein [Crocinitomix catalasitica]